MPIYRVTCNLENLKEGDIIKDTWRAPDVMAILERKGRIRRLNTPPLDQIPGWRLRFKRLEQIGVFTIEDFLDAQKGEIIEALGHKSDEAYRQYIDELYGWLGVGKVKRG